ncbi:hypothetical protein [Veillonella seminalis]|uniref:BppU N-terminal domain-containing protein n=1 Tax=Veillonella seminalis ACS-216-V-Col6b TaxID=883156 RepID=K9D6D2_9FIRM|nr:hypothetical protein [Veillonella seminalis]EKU78766.1 hypothetical protein HMPREF9282_00563 [Veillonella seminalis ACS-216-V-Col6b]
MAKKGKSHAAEYDFTLDQGSDYRFQLEIYNSDDTPKDITKNTYVCKIRRDAEDEEVLTEAVATIISNNIVEFHFRDEDTGNIDTDGLNYQELTEATYDILQITPDGEVTRLVNGFCSVSPGISYH